MSTYTIRGTNGNDTLAGSSADDLIEGGQGHDTILGWLGADTLDGSAGNDVLVAAETTVSMSGGDGEDQLFLGQPAAGVTLVAGGGAGRDTFILEGENAAGCAASAISWRDRQVIVLI